VGFRVNVNAVGKRKSFGPCSWGPNPLDLETNMLFVKQTNKVMIYTHMGARGSVAG
jgi:hypothetical protein